MHSAFINACQRILPLHTSSFLILTQSSIWDTLRQNDTSWQILTHPGNQILGSHYQGLDNTELISVSLLHHLCDFFYFFFEWLCCQIRVLSKFSSSEADCTAKFITPWIPLLFTFKVKKKQYHQEEKVMQNIWY